MSSARATVTFDWEPHDKQRSFIDSDARFRVLNWGRRTGKNETAVIDCIKYALENPDATVWWVAPSYQQADDYGFERMVAKLPDALVRGEPTLSNPKEIELINGTIISFKSADKPENLKGAGVDYVVIDEAASIPDRIWYEYLRPTLSDTLGEAVVISTPKGKDWFHELYHRADDDPEVWASHATSYANPYVEDDEIDNVQVPERIFKQEYLAEFVDDAGVVFTDIPVESYDYAEREGVEPYRIGVDYARHHDWTVIIALDADGYVVEMRRTQDVKWTAIQSEIERVYEQYPGPVAVDATRDNKITEDLEASGIPVDPVKFTTQRKRDMVEDLAAMLESNEIIIPESAGTLRRELEAYEYEVTARGNIKYQAPSHEHDDTVDSLAMAATVEGAVSATWG